MLEFKHLRTFVAVAESGTFTQAAAELHYSQSSVTEQIQALESELGNRLFDRSGRRPVLTAAGRLLVDYAEQLLALGNQARVAVQRVAEPAGSLTVGGLETLCAYRLPEILARLHGLAPGVRVVVRQGTRGELFDGVRRGELDLGFTFGPPPPGHGLTTRVLEEVRLVVVAPPQHPLGSPHRDGPHGDGPHRDGLGGGRPHGDGPHRDGPGGGRPHGDGPHRGGPGGGGPGGEGPGGGPVRLAELAGVGFLATEPGCGFREMYDRALGSQGTAGPTLIAQVASIAALRACVSAGMGLALLPEMVVLDGIKRGELAAVPLLEEGPEPPFRTTLNVSWLAGPEPSAELAWFLDLFAPEISDI